ncbi:MAG: cadmium-translocating P-type ATPase [Haliscomenobacter sp.]|nr:cadmium-translocating P-type ATPase [Haliscomenobacter sp.]
MEKKVVELKVEGMDCANCAQSITRYLERKGLEDVFVSFQTKEVRFKWQADQLSLDEIKKGIAKLGYTIAEPNQAVLFWTLERKLAASALFTLPLLLHHLGAMAGIHFHALGHPAVQFALCLPVFALGAWHFGKSGLGSMKSGTPNMDVLIFIGGTAAFVYSLVGWMVGEPDYIFFETSATIFTLVFLGNYIEHRAVGQTTSAIEELSKLQVKKARRIMASGTVISIDHDDIETGFILQVNEGDQVPADGRILSGSATLDESLLTGEPSVRKTGRRSANRGSLVPRGNVTMEVTAVGDRSLLGQMIELVKTAQQDKPSIQRLADQISAIFVPAVLVIAAVAFMVNYFGFDVSFQKSLMNSIAVLVISCPCAMGLATPTAIMVGVGRLARNGILVKGGQTVEIFSQVRRIVFDKTGTLTTGQFKIQDIAYHTPDHNRVNALVYFLEKHSSHPIAQSLVEALEHRQNGVKLEPLTVVEDKGIGVTAQDQQGNLYKVGSRRIFSQTGEAPSPASVFLTCNNHLLAEFYLEDEVKEEAPAVIRALQSQGIEPVIISGDHRDKTARVATLLGVKEYHAEQLPSEKLRFIERYAAQEPTAMVGDGINDAPALAKATIGVSLSNASQTAIQSAQIILLNGRIDFLIKALEICKHTVLTIRQSLGWAFAYNIVAIPIAAAGFLNPMWGALFMAFSDVVVIGNAIRLRHKWIKGVGRR